MKLLRLIALCFIVLFIGVGIVWAQQSETEIQGLISQYEQKITELRNQKDTLSKQISLFDSQITLTNLRINSLKGAIDKLSLEIDELNDEINRLEILKTKRLELVLHRIPETYKRNIVSQFGIVFFSKNVSDFLSRIKYLSKVQAENAELYTQLQNTQDTYGERKDVREKKKEQQEDLRRQLEQQNANLVSQKKQKQALLAQSQNDEGTYQRLLSQARAQLASFAKFASYQGGGILSGQTFCDGWGCYYNQRDSQWGYTLINGSNDCGGPCNVARVGCLVASVAMAASHLGRKDISPGDIATSDPSNFSVGTAYLAKTITVKGTTIRRTSAGSLNPDVVSNGPVIVGIYYGQFGTHFVVVKSYQDGKYIMNDPYQAGGHDVSFTDHYSLEWVFSVERVSI